MVIIQITLKDDGTSMVISGEVLRAEDSPAGGSGYRQYFEKGITGSG